MKAQTPQAQALDPRSIAHLLAKSLEKRLEALLMERYGEKAAINYLSWDVKGKEQITIEVDVDITELLIGERPELRKKSVEFRCGDAIAEESVCDPEDPRYDEEECRRRFMECEEEHVKEFEERECDIGLKFSIVKSWGLGLKLMSWVVSYVTDDLYYYQCIVELRNRIELRKPEWIRSIDEWAEGEAEFLAWRIISVIEALRGLYEAL